MQKIKIVRHSERLDFTNPLYWLMCIGQYWADSPLTKNGHTMAQNKGLELSTDSFNPKYIYTSPYNRTIATATEISKSFPKADVVIQPLLSEYQPNFAHNIALYPNGIDTKFEGEETGIKFPETETEFSNRVQFILEKLINKDPSDMMIVTHGEFIKKIIDYIRELDNNNVEIEANKIPYLTVISFEYDHVNKKIDISSVKIQ